MKTNKIKKTAIGMGAGLLAFAGLTEQAQGQGSEELFQFSRHNFGLSSARSAGMGGAFTSLGADGLSMSLNPAGIAMYKSGELTLSPGFRISSQDADYSGTKGSVRNSESNTRFNLGSGALIYADRAGRGDNWFAVGFGMNRLADFNGKSRAIGYGEEFSIGDMFAEQLYGNRAGSIGAPDNDIYQAFYNYPPSMWGALLGYQSALVDPVNFDDPNNTEYTLNGVIDPGALLQPGWNRRTKGAINEYVVSGGFNWQDIVYVGATIGIQDIYYNRYDSYSEFAPSGNSGLDRMFYNQNLRMSGTGVNLKIGVTARPVSWLRLGVAYHSPTWISMDEEYDADMTVFRREQGQRDPIKWYADTPILMNDYNMRTPARFLAGISAVLGDFGIISFDYERTWYNKMKYTSDGYEDVNAWIGELYRPSNIFRVGAEFQPFQSFFVRAGYGYSSSAYNDSSLKKYGEYQQISAGIGYRARSFSIDLAYINGRTHQMPFKPYDYEADDGYPVVTDGTIYTKEHNHNIILTLGFRF